MSPGFIQSTRSGGFGMNRDFGRSVGRAVNHTATRDFAGQRDRFSITTDDSGKPSVRLDEGETGKIVVNADGSFSVVVSPKPAASAAATPPAAAPAEPVETASRRAFGRFARTFAGRNSNKAIVTTQSNGSILIEPEAGEVLTVVDDGATSGAVGIAIAKPAEPVKPAV